MQCIVKEIQTNYLFFECIEFHLSFFFVNLTIWYTLGDVISFESNNENGVFWIVIFVQNLISFCVV